MTKQEALSYMGWEELPEAAEESMLKCPVLVKRTSGVKDYAISNKKRIVADLAFRSSIVKVIEYYPPEKDKEELKTTEPVKQKEKKVVVTRDEMIEFLVKHKNKLSVIEVMPNDELRKLCKIYGLEL